MCGIIAVRRWDGISAKKVAMRLYRKQKERGQEGFGFISMLGNKIEKFRKSESETPILKELQETIGTDVVFHHRKPTSTPNFWEAAHPIHVSHPMLKYDYFVVHNGSLLEADSKRFKESHDKLGFEYKTLIRQCWETRNGARRYGDEKWNDSEAFAIELAIDLDGPMKTMRGTWGKIAFVCIQYDKVNNKAVKMYWGRNNGSPLFFRQTDRYYAITSVGEGKEIDNDVLYSYDYASNKYEDRKYDLGYSSYSKGYYGGYSGHDYREDAPRNVEVKKEKPVSEADVIDSLFKKEGVELLPTESGVEKYTRVHGQLQEVRRQLIEDDSMDGEERTALIRHAASLEEILDVLEVQYPTITPR